LALAAPTPSFISNLLKAEPGITTAITTALKSAVTDAQTLSAALAKLGVKLSTDASKHGSVWNQDNLCC